MTSKGSDDELLDLLDDHLDTAVLSEEYPIEDVDADLRKLGADPEAVGRRGQDLVYQLLEEQRLSWQTKASERIRAMRAAVAAIEPIPDDATHEDLEQELRLLQLDPTVGAQMEAHFSKRTTGEMSYEELRVYVTEGRKLRALVKEGR